MFFVTNRRCLRFLVSYFIVLKIFFSFLLHLQSTNISSDHVEDQVPHQPRQPMSDLDAMAEVQLLLVDNYLENLIR